MPGWRAQCWTHEMPLQRDPQPTNDDILAGLAFAAETMRDEPDAAADQAAA